MAKGRTVEYRYSPVGVFNDTVGYFIIFLGEDEELNRVTGTVDNLSLIHISIPCVQLRTVYIFRPLKFKTEKESQDLSLLHIYGGNSHADSRGTAGTDNSSENAP